LQRVPWLEIVRWVVAAPLFLLAAVGTVGNAGVVVSWVLGHRSSMIPLVGGTAGALGCLVAPGLLGWAWLPPLADLGCVPIVVFALVWRVVHGPPDDRGRGTPRG
jgi:hypothetical protein